MRLGIGISEDLPVAVQQRLAEDVEAAGFASLWTNEASGRDALLLCQAWAAATTQLEVGVGVVPIWTRTPAQIAMAAATLQEVSGGRFLLGLGVSHPATMGPWHGVEVRRPLTASRELLELLAVIEAGERTAHPGEVLGSERFRLAVTPRPPATRRYLAAMGPRMLELAGTHADGVLLNWAGPGAVAEAVDRVRAAAAAAGRDPDSIEVAAYVRVAVHRDASAARAALAKQIAAYGALPAYAAHLERQGHGEAITRAQEVRRGGGDGLALAEALGAQALADLGWAGGWDDDPAEVLERYAAAGLDHLIARVVVVDEPVGAVQRVVRALDHLAG
jgi:alkanesulfonate monooxygenase SsuD/methylene tetrahydromethanopterin reductase-like flavin-dependent oxidoreductase (luciferase family)